MQLMLNILEKQPSWIGVRSGSPQKASSQRKPEARSERARIQALDRLVRCSASFFGFSGFETYHLRSQGVLQAKALRPEVTNTWTEVAPV